MPILPRRSYTEAVEGRRRLFSRLRLLLVLFVSLEIISSLFLGAFAVLSTSMVPGILPGDRLLASPIVYGPRGSLGKIPGLAKPSRGELVLIDPPYAEDPGFWISAADAVLRFLSLQKFSLLRRGPDALFSSPLLERVIAVPGDFVLMEDFVFKVKPAGQSHYLTEFELSERRYDIEKPLLPELWRDDYPLSGSMESRLLGKDEYFLAGDDRGSSSDSRFWGPLPLSRFKAKVLLRYWPLSRFGSP